MASKKTDAVAIKAAESAAEVIKAALQDETPKAPKASKRTVDLDSKLAGKGTFAVGVQAMMRERINKRG